jgi:hypothetical protein
MFRYERIREESRRAENGADRARSAEGDPSPLPDVRRRFPELWSGKPHLQEVQVDRDLAARLSAGASVAV